MYCDDTNPLKLPAPRYSFLRNEPKRREPSQNDENELRRQLRLTLFANIAH